MKAIEPDASLNRRPLVAYFLATRPQFLVVTLTGCLLGLAVIVHSNVLFSLTNALVTLIFALITQASCNLLNDYYDDQNGTDAYNTQHIYPFTGGSRFITNNVLSRYSVGLLAYSLLVLVIAAGLWLTMRSAPGLIIIGLLGLIIGWAYSAPPLELVSRGLGEFCITACWLLVVVGSDYVQRAAFSWDPVIAGLAYAILVALILYMNQIPDAAADIKAKKLTLAARLGPRYARWGYLAMVVVAYGFFLLQIATEALPLLALIALLPLALHLMAFQILNKHRFDDFATASMIELAPAIKATIAATNLHGLLLAVILTVTAR